MPFKLLRQIVSHIRRTLGCPACRERFEEEDFDLIGAGPSGRDAYHALFFAMCIRCNEEIFIFAELYPPDGKSKKQKIYVETKSAKISEGGIKMDDILDMHNFLKTWHGDVKELF